MFYGLVSHGDWRVGKWKISRYFNHNLVYEGWLLCDMNLDGSLNGLCLDIKVGFYLITKLWNVIFRENIINGKWISFNLTCI